MSDKKKSRNKNDKKNVMYEMYPNDPDLILLRDAAIDERNAIALYLEAAMETDLKDLFLDVAEDEMHHYVETMQAISRLDPVQARYLKKENLTDLTMVRALNKNKFKNQTEAKAEPPEALPAVPSQKDMKAIRYLTKALGDELGAVNKYQNYMAQAQHDFVADLFGHLMNEEKEHVAEFTAALYDITGEPLPPEDKD